MRGQAFNVVLIKTVVPVPTYFTIGKLPLPEVIQEKIQQSGGEVAPNLLFLGELKGQTTVQELIGLRQILRVDDCSRAQDRLRGRGL